MDEGRQPTYEELEETVKKLTVQLQFSEAARAAEQDLNRRFLAIIENLSVKVAQ